MKNFFIRNSAGQITRMGSCSADTFKLQAQDGETVHEGVPEVKPMSASVRGDGYAAKRFEAYPSINDQLDTIFHSGLDVWKAQIQAVKNKYPKV